MIIQSKNSKKYYFNVYFTDGIYHENYHLDNSEIQLQEEDVIAYYNKEDIQNEVELKLEEYRNQTDKLIEILAEENIELEKNSFKPVEIHEDVAKDIENIKKHFNFWEIAFLNYHNWNENEKEKFKSIAKLIYSERVSIIKNGYIIKKKPNIKKEIENILLSNKDYKIKTEKIVNLLKEQGMEF